MRIAIFTEVYTPYVSGISSYIEVLKTGLERLGHNVVVVTSSLHSERPVLKRGVVRCPARKSNNKYGYECRNINDPTVFNAMKKFAPDVVHIHTDTKIGYMGLSVADKLRIPVVFTVHDNYLDRFASKKSVVAWRFKTFFEKNHFRDMIDNSQVITSSNKRASLFVREAGRNRRVMLIPTAADKRRFDYKKVSRDAVLKMRRKLDIPLNAVVAVFAGDLSVDKNLEFVFTAFARYMKNYNVHFLIVGGGTETDYLKSVCVRLRIRDRVHFTGVVAHSIMPSVLSACDIYVCSSEDSLMSMSFVEAIACGLPVLVKEDKEKFAYHMIKDGVNGFVYSDEESFTEYLRTLASFTPEKKQRMKFIVRNSLKNYNAEYMAKSMEKAYKQALKAWNINVDIIK